MIYDAIISTGTTTVSGCSSAELGTDTYSVLNRKSVGAQNTFYYDRSISTGQSEIQLALNSQTLLQEVPVTGQATNQIIYQIYTGSFFTKGEEADIMDQSKFHFPSSTPVGSLSTIVYNIVTGGICAATGDLGNSLKTSIVAGIGASATFNTCDYFLNGQKVYSGVGVGVSLGSDGTDFIPRFGTAANVGGVVTSANKNKFKYTAYKKRVRTVSMTGIGPDVYCNTGFIEKRTNFYINGLQELQSNYLELFTGVTIIKTGLSAMISGGLGQSLIGENVLL